ncbi:MAG: hypothetical protein JWP01_3267 [Myxococcales bacterium]|nr:hypothetical protein [Myxococcales bacterium]
MLRALLAGILAVSAAASCKGGGDAPTFQPGAPAGSIIDISGTVTATRGTAVRPLELGAVISGDDVIDTSADSRVAIVLTHNNVRWEIGPSRKAQVGTSMAWTLARQEKPSKIVDEETSAAGRHGEKTAATSATNTHVARDEQAGQDRESPPGPTRAAPLLTDPAAEAPAAAAPAVEAAPIVTRPRAAAEPELPRTPPPPPPAKNEDAKQAPQKAQRAVTASSKRKADDRDAADKGAGSTAPGRSGGTSLGAVGTTGHGAGASGRGGGAGGGGGGALETSSAPPSIDQQVRTLWARDRKALAACLDGAQASITVTVTSGIARIDGTDAAITDKTRACFRAISARWKLTASGNAAVTVKLQLAK